MPFVLQNVSRNRLSFALRPVGGDESRPQWRVKKETRRDTMWVNIEPGMSIDLCEHPWNLTEKDADFQVEVKSMLNKGYVRRIEGDHYKEEKPLFVVGDLPNYPQDPLIASGATSEAPKIKVASILDSLALQPKVKQGDTYESPAPGVIEPSSLPPEISDFPVENTDRFVRPEDLPVPPGSQKKLPEDEPTNPSAPISKKVTPIGKAALVEDSPQVRCSKGVHNNLGGTCKDCGVAIALVCLCKFVGKNSQSLKMHQKSCKEFQLAKQANA
jgi:hypothetical protein